MANRPLHLRRRWPAARGGGGFTLIELLVVISVIAVLVSVLLPALQGARSEGMAGKCLANLRGIGQSSAMYIEAQDDLKLLPWYQYPAHGGTLSSPGGTYGISLFTPWVFGGFKAPQPDRSDYVPDAHHYPTEIRPLNRIVDPTALGNTVIPLYICPGDRSYSTAVVGQSGGGAEDEQMLSSWQANGSSYTLNTRWAQGYAYPTGYFTLDDFAFGRAPDNIPFGRRIARTMIGGQASQFIIWGEQGFYSATYCAGPTADGVGGGAQPQRRGWHRKWSAWTCAFADGHARYGYFDTRQIYGLDGTIWQPGFRPGE